MSRLLRRQIFEALASQQHNPNEKYRMVMFGSGAIQQCRPTQGYPVRRLARDLDIGIVIPKNGYRVTEDIDERTKGEIGNYVLNAVQQAGAAVVPESIKGIPGYDGLTVTKSYTPEEIRQYLRGKLEESDIEIPKTPLTVSLKISELYIQTPLLPIRPFGDKGFYHMDIREVFGIKLRRMTSAAPVYELKDTMDAYNLISSGQIVPERDADLLRAIALVFKAKDHEGHHSRATLANLEPTEANVTSAAHKMGVTDLAFMKQVLETVYRAVNIIFPKERSQLPEHLAGALHLTRDELNFITGLHGVEHLAAGGMRRIDPKIDPGLIISDALAREFPHLSRNISDNHELERVIQNAVAERNGPDF